MRRSTGLLLAAALVLGVAQPAAAGYDRSFATGSLVVPMDLAYQDQGMFQAYGLVFQLLRQGVTVYWVIDPNKTWHDAACDTPADECAWDCADVGSGPCSYPTASPDFTVGAQVVWDDGGAMSPGDTISSHGYRGGPFVIDAADATAARAIIDAWNDPALWGANPWAERSVPGIVTVHETTADFDGYVRKEMVAAPTIAVFSDGNEDIATGYLRAAGIPQSDGSEFPVGRCGAGECGPGTINPDMLTVESIMGEMGTCDAPNLDHRNGSLFTTDGVPAFCQIMSMHWGVDDRETVECDGGGCPATAAECSGETFTYHGHEVVAEVRQFLEFPTHFFAECQAVNAYENTVPNPDWPYLDDEGRNGHFLTTTGTPPDCPCSDGDFECVAGGCGGRDCCLPRDIREVGAGFMIADQPDENTLQVLHPDIPYNQLDGFFGTVGGSEPAYNLSTYLGTTYIGDADVTFITGPSGPGAEDVWMTGYVDGVCDIGHDEFMRPGECTLGKVSYLGGHRYDLALPLSANRDSQGARLFLNALFEADCVTTAGAPALALSIAAVGGNPILTPSVPVPETFTIRFVNSGPGAAIDGELTAVFPAEVQILDAGGGTVDAGRITWPVGSIGPTGSTDPSASGMRDVGVSVTAVGVHSVTAELRYRVGATWMIATAAADVEVAIDSDGDGVPDDVDPAPNDPNRCGDANGDGCDDCDPRCAGDAGPGGGGGDGCGCRVGGSSGPRGLFTLAFIVAALFWRRR